MERAVPYGAAKGGRHDRFHKTHFQGAGSGGVIGRLPAPWKWQHELGFRSHHDRETTNQHQDIEKNERRCVMNFRKRVYYMIARVLVFAKTHPQVFVKGSPTGQLFEELE